MHHLLLHCDVVHALWVDMLQTFGINWVMPGFVASLLFCWRNWCRKHGSDIWNMVLGCLMWNVCNGQNHHLLEDTKNSLDQLKALCLRTHFELSRCRGSSDYSSIIEFLVSHRMAILFLYFCFHCSLVFIVMNSKILLFFINKTAALVTYQKRKNSATNQLKHSAKQTNKKKLNW